LGKSESLPVLLHLQEDARPGRANGKPATSCHAPPRPALDADPTARTESCLRRMASRTWPGSLRGCDSIRRPIL